MPVSKIFINLKFKKGMVNTTNNSLGNTIVIQPLHKAHIEEQAFRTHGAVWCPTMRRQ